MAYYPFMVDLKGKKILVAGGGPVAWRKCRTFLDFGAAVVLAAPKLCPELAALLEGEAATALIWRKETYCAALLTEELFAVVAATDDRKVNRQIAADCRTRRLPVNVADAPELCSFFLPAVVRRGDLTLAVSTGGQSPGLAAKLCRELAERYDEGYGQRLALLGRLRTRLLAGSLPVKERRRQLLAAAELSLTDLRLLAEQEAETLPAGKESPAKAFRSSGTPPKEEEKGD